MGKTLATIFKEAGVHPWATILIGLLYVSAFFFSAYRVIKAPLKTGDLQVVNGRLLTEPELSFTTLKSGTRLGAITFRLSENSDLVFIVRGNSYDATARGELLSDLHRLDSVQFLIEPEMYRQKIVRKERDGILTSLLHDYHDYIPVYGIAGKNGVYLRPGDIANESKADPAVFLLLITASGAWLFRDILKKFISRQG